jgi:hypothetical protein
MSVTEDSITWMLGDPEGRCAPGFDASSVRSHAGYAQGLMDVQDRLRAKGLTYEEFVKLKDQGKMIAGREGKTNNLDGSEDDQTWLKYRTARCQFCPNDDGRISEFDRESESKIVNVFSLKLDFLSRVQRLHGIGFWRTPNADR